jgi:putative sporulation protein YyaC
MMRKNEEVSVMKVSMTESNAAVLLSNELTALLGTEKELVFVCIGTDRSTGDSYGPLVGRALNEMISRYSIEDVSVYGTLHEPVHAVNLDDTIERIKRDHPGATVVAIDACLGRLKSVGHVILKEGSLNPGAGVKKELTPVGDFHLAGVVNIAGFKEFFVLQSTRLSVVMDLSELTVKSIQSYLLRRKTLSGRKILEM